MGSCATRSGHSTESQTNWLPMKRLRWMRSRCAIYFPCTPCGNLILLVLRLQQRSVEAPIRVSSRTSAEPREDLRIQKPEPGVPGVLSISWLKLATHPSLPEGPRELVPAGVGPDRPTSKESV